MNASPLPKETHIGQVHLRVADFGRALGFYQGLLGFKIIAQEGNNVLLAASESGPVLIVLTEDPVAPLQLTRRTGLYHVAIRYPERRDLAHALQRLFQANYPIEGASDHDVSEAIYLSDPDNNGVELYTDRPRSTWHWRDGQVAMSTKPLDLGNLLATIDAKTSPPGPPPQTDIGHIHLHVAHLDAAERFFHEFLGLDVTQRAYPGALFLSAGGYHHHIGVNTWAGPLAPPANSLGLISYRLELPSSEALAELRERNLEFGYEMREIHNPDSELLEIRDPTGNWLEVRSARVRLTVPHDAKVETPVLTSRGDK